MCKEQFEVVGIDTQRTAYEVEQYLLGLPHIDDVSVDMFDDQVVVQYDESSIDHDYVLDEIENSGCKPCERIDGLFDRLRTKIAGV